MYLVQLRIAPKTPKPPKILSVNNLWIKININ